MIANAMLIHLNGKVGFRTKQFFVEETTQEKSNKQIGSKYFPFSDPSKNQQKLV